MMDSKTLRPQSTMGGSGGFRFSENNFDLIRLVAAAEVAVKHTLVHVAPDQFPYWLKVCFALVPGVPIFFFLSGFLISRSWERSPSAGEYFRNRALRLFPALWVCVAFAAILLFATGYMAMVDWDPLRLMAWMVGQGTVFQFWTPEFLRGFGVGAVNGSLWSVSVEIQFYAVTALLYSAIRRLSSLRQTMVLGLLAVGFSFFNGERGVVEAIIEDTTGSWIAMKLYGVSFVPWYFMFLCGAVAQRLSWWLIPVCIDRAPLILCAYVVAMLIDFHAWGLPLGNDMPPYLVPLMGLAVIAAAYSRPSLAHRVLRGNDLSYGLYIYHMPIVNAMIQLGRVGDIAWVIVSLVFAAISAAVSWLAIEQPFLRRKRAGLRIASPRVRDVTRTGTQPPGPSTQRRAP
jgi:peptidoglycan/LPS O-acetylase OafA/YrhL